MKQIRSNLSRLKTRVIEKITQENDILDFPGVNKTDIINFINQAYGLTERLEVLRDTFAVVALKRKIAPTIDACKATLDAATSEMSDKAQFDQFLNNLTRIHDDIYLTYVVYCSDGINIEADIGTATTSLDDIKNEINTIRPIVTDLSQSINILKENIGSSKELLEEQQEHCEQGKEELSEIAKAKTSALASAEVITKYEANAKNEQDTINSLARKAAQTQKHIKEVISEVTEKTKQIDETLQKSINASLENKKQQSEIRKTLDAASQYGMAASFKKRKDELNTSMIIWGIVFIVTIVALFITGIVCMMPYIKNDTIPQLPDILIKITLVTPLIWLGWMAAKQYAYIARIREDYSFKYASALAI